MISELIKKIEDKSKQLSFKASRGYKSHGNSSIPYEQLIVINKEYPDKIFVVHKNMSFGRNSIQDTFYTVYSFDIQGDFLKEEDVEELGFDFFTNMETVHKI